MSSSGASTAWTSTPLAVELARVSLWVETLDPELPFSFLDHKIKVGNSLGRLLAGSGGGLSAQGLGTGRRRRQGRASHPADRGVPQGREDRQTPHRRWPHQAGDAGGHREPVQQADPSLFPEHADYCRSGRCRGPSRVRNLHSLPIGDPDERERFYREHVQASPALRRLKQAMDEWCAVWFWPADEESLRHVPTPLTFHQPSETGNGRHCRAGWQGIEVLPLGTGISRCLHAAAERVRCHDRQSALGRC